jgi:cytochrome c oxidase subunit III
MAEATEKLTTSAWGGGALPYAIGSKKFGMWLFIVSDSLTFSGLLIGYSYVRMASDNWSTPFPFWPSIIFASLMTFVLLSSSLTMVLGVHAAHKGDRKRAVQWILATALGGILFIVLHGYEWNHLIHEGLTLSKNPWGGDPLFGGTFFTLTGLHMFHVFSGVVYLIIVAAGFGKGRFSDEDVEVSGLYWHFVDLVWMFIFPLVYLLSIRY